jgi:PAS domain S-box-containing protein
MPTLNHWELTGLFLIIIACICIIQYLHIRRYVLKPLARLEERYRQIFNNSLNGIAYHEVVRDDESGEIDYRFVEVNPAFEELTGLKASEVIGKCNREVLPEAEQAIFEQIYSQVAETGEPDRREIYSSTLERCFQVAAFSPIPNFYAAIFTDTTKQKKYEQSLKDQSAWLETLIEERTEELREAQAKLIQREKMAQLGQLARGIAHELRNPLGVISNAVYYLKSLYVKDEGTTREYLSIIETEVNRSEKTITDLLEYSREPVPIFERTDICELLQKILEGLSTPDSIQITTKVNASAPAAQIDDRQIGMVLNNLLTNAFQAMPEGGNLDIEISQQDDNVRLAIHDTGSGIAAHNIQTIFEPFFTTKPKGIGLGLAISKTLAEVNGGEISVESTENEGSTFTLILPRAEETVAPTD